ncbi:Glycosyl transferase protein [Pseudomonas syringae pv. primulae]|uniref:Beta-monoglucosyldiacylglycerol synthase n=2 Tax=Pseudomonas syringae group genomosp. 3 TaxID=251701 RepID=A0A3M3XNP7_9PSED|nr:glycosyltransferase [Pseudomonas syringae group genomosp. 3]RMO71659.1 Glycosyl transferase protein [Pseudomonas syringae pv. primulae]RMU40698.1 Glycosyl transferase protein [Pseudomonas syringae pv. primulae]
MHPTIMIRFMRLKKRFLQMQLFQSRLTEVPDWPANISGFSYAPFRPDQRPGSHLYPTREQIKEDLLLIKPFTQKIRTYSVEGTLAYIPEIAEELGMSVTLGVWISPDEVRNTQELNTAIEITNRCTNVQRLIVGNEVLYRGDISPDQLIEHIETARRHINVPVGTSETWMQWLEAPELAEHSDFIAAHILPFWERSTAATAASTVIAQAQQLQRQYPDKLLILSEVGWPSKGNATRRTSTTPAEQAISLRTQLSLLAQHDYLYFVIEAFDQPWKTGEGTPGPHWGVFNSQRQLKLQLYGPVEERVRWRSVLSNLVIHLRPGSWYTTLAITIVLYCALIIAALACSRLLQLWITLPISVLWATCLLAGIAIESHEFLEAVWGPEQPRTFLPARCKYDNALKVSVHVPCHNEPPDMVKRTLDSLQKLDYPNFEVLVIDNNTQDRTTWEPVERHCQQLGARFKFFHVNPLPGFKAGALNYLIGQTAPDAEIVAVIDADYCVNRLWLKHMVPHFTNPKIAVIQVPQDYSDGHKSPFKYCCNAEYKGFFEIGMVIRNDHDAIIQHGTMTLIRRSALEQLGWAQWCICEDAELGLRMLENGFSTGYTPLSYGKGLTPDTFSHFKKQRYRWAYGAMQIIKQHAWSLIAGRCEALSTMQRYHFMAGWVPWVTEGVNYLLMLATLFWSVAMIMWPDTLAPVPWIFSTSLLLLFTLRILKVLCLYQQRVSTDVTEALAAILAGMALYPTIGKAVLSGLVTSGMPFFRTPKQTSGKLTRLTLFDATEDVCTVLISWITIVLLLRHREAINMDLGFWIAMLFAQSLPYLAAVVMAILSALANRPSRSTT